MHWCVLIVPTGDAWLARQRSPGVAYLYHSLYIVFPIILYRLVTMPELLKAGQPSFWHGPTSVLAGGKSMNTVQGLGHQELTGRGLGITMHQHYGYRVHFELGGEFGSRSFERRFSGYQSCKHFCISVIRGYPEGLCECMWCGKGFPSMPPGLTRGGTRRYALPRRLCIKRWSPVFTDGRPGR